jgi:hypothetical protein
MVTFSQMPYSKAMSEGKRQEEIMQKIMSIPEIEGKWNSGSRDWIKEYIN